MQSKYDQLGFALPNILENPYGIRIYIGTKGEEDWCVEIPKELCKFKCSYYDYDKNYIVYLVSEEYALEVAEKWTKLAKQMKK